AFDSVEALRWRERGVARAGGLNDLVCTGQGRLQSFQGRRLVACRGNGLFDVADRQVGHARRQPRAGLGQGGIGACARSRRIRLIGTLATYWAASRSMGVAIASTPATVDIVRAFGGIIGIGKATRPNDAAEYIVAPIAPEWMVGTPRPNDSGKDVAQENRPEHGAEPAAAVVPPGPPAVPGYAAGEPIAANSENTLMIEGGEAVAEHLTVGELIGEATHPICGAQLVSAAHPVNASQVGGRDMVLCKAPAAKTSDVAGVNSGKGTVTAEVHAAEPVGSEAHSAKPRAAEMPAAKPHAAEMSPS